MEDRAIDPEMVFTRCCCCLPAGSCRGQVNDDRQAFTGMSSFSTDLLLVNYRHRHWSLFPVYVVASWCRLLRSQPRLSSHHGSLHDGTAPGMQSKTSSPSAEALDVHGFNGLVTYPYSLKLGQSKVNTAFLACQGMKQPLPPSPLRVPKSTQRLDDVSDKFPPPLCFTCTYVVHKQPVAVAWHQHDI
ncbi:uncharacterized protein B0T23DRAFT_164241 [Neurospora hispaniola]|uniref:Uncharacterized protein n=1 Tax=Neurospora hispaniola TaxID=588809 RepID=A0AAJ0I5L5_9PEZI|nr:hypothetical protein B0T23DRAFT_164241 [Neurospora hispaniola]